MPKQIDICPIFNWHCVYHDKGLLSKLKKDIYLCKGTLLLYFHQYSTIKLPKGMRIRLVKPLRPQLETTKTHFA